MIATVWPDMTPFPAPTRRVALLIDGDNLSSAHAETAISTAGRHGTPIIRRVYGNVTNLNGWTKAPGFRVIHSGSGKNATDVLLAVEAMALMLGHQAEVLILASSDGDFTHLAQHLTERGLTVIGIGTDQAQDRFRRSCTDFVVLKAPDIPAPAAPAKAIAVTPATDPLITLTINLLRQNANSLSVADLSTKMKNLNNIQIGQTPYKSWRAFLTAHPHYFNCDPKGPTARVHPKS